VNLCQALDIKFMPFYAWTQIWASLMHIILAMTNMCDLIAWVTRYSCETFGCLIAIIYLYTGAKGLAEYFFDEMDAALLSMLLGMGTFLGATFLAGARSWKIMGRKAREITVGTHEEH
jgi:boron transporter